MDEVGVCGFGLGARVGGLRGFGGFAMVPVEGCCAVEEDGVERPGGGVVRGFGEEIGWEGGEGSEEGWE